MATTPDFTARTLARNASLLLALWLGFWLLALGLVLGLLWIPFVQIHYKSTLDLAGIIATGAALTLAWSLRPRSDEKDKNRPVPLSRNEAEKLYAMIERIGHQIGIDAPVDIHLVGAATAFIYGHRNWMGRIKRLQVGLGLPMLGTLSEAELGSVIAHEFGHFVAGDLSLGPWVYRTRTSIAHTVHDLDDSIFFFDILFRWYGQWFLRLSRRVSRQQELAADAQAARHFGIPATRAALEKIHLIDPMWSSYLDHEVFPALNRGVRPPIFAGFRLFCLPGTKRPEVQAAITRAEHQPTDDYDSHPSLEDRVAALVPGAKPAWPALTSCFELLGGETAAENLWLTSIKASQLPTCEWENYGSGTLQPQIEQRFAKTWMDPEQLPLTELPQLASTLDQLWVRLKPEGVSLLSPQGKRNHVQAILEEWIVACLCHAGFTPRPHPGLPLKLEQNGTSLQPAQMLADAIAGKLDVVQLRQIAGTGRVSLVKG